MRARQNVCRPQLPFFHQTSLDNCGHVLEANKEVNRKWWEKMSDMMLATDLNVAFNTP